MGQTIHAANWPQFQFDHENRATNQAERIGQSEQVFAELVSTEQGATVFNTASAIAYGDEVCVGSVDGSVVGVDRADGAERWRVRTGGPIRGAPAFDDGRVYVTSEDGVFRCLDPASNGDELWSYRVGTSLPASPTVGPVGSDSYVFIAGTDGVVRCLRAADGTPVWSASLAGQVWGAPALNPDTGRLYVGSYDGCVSALNASSGEVVWQTDPAPAAIPLGPIRAAVAVHGENLYVPTLQQGLVSLRDQGTQVVERWCASFTGSHTGSAAVVVFPDDSSATIYVGSDEGKLFSIRGADGTKIWERDVSSRIAGSVAYASGLAFVCAEDGTLHAFEGDLEGEERFQVSTTEALDSSPAVSGGRVYVLTASSILHSFGNTLEPPQSLTAFVDVTRQVSLSWVPVLMPPSDTPVSAYRIYRSKKADADFAEVAWVPGISVIQEDPLETMSTSVYVDSSLAEAGTYYYAVTALHDVSPEAGLEESTYSNISGTTFAPLLPPTDLRATQVAGAIVLDWTPTTTPDAAGYEIYRRSYGDTDYVLLDAVAGPLVDTYTDDSLVNGGHYQYVLVTLDAEGNRSVNSNIAEATILPALFSVSPDNGPVHQHVTLTGEFGGSPSAVSVMIGGVSAKVLSVTADTILAVVPQGLTPGASSIRVWIDTTGSVPLDFTVTGQTGGLAQTGWPMYRANNLFTAEGLGIGTSDPQFRWLTAIPHEVWSGGIGTLVLREDGKLLGHSLPWSNAHIFMFDRANGALEKIVPLPDVFQTLAYGPAVDRNGVLYVNRGDILMAFDSSLTLKWVVPGVAPGSSPSIGQDGTIYVAAGDRRGVMAIGSDGHVKWRAGLPGTPVTPSVQQPPMVLSDGTVLLPIVGDGGGNVGRLVGINPDGTTKFVGPNTPGLLHPRGFTGSEETGLVYIGGSDPVEGKSFFALRMTDGGVEFQTGPFQGRDVGPLDRTHGNVFVFIPRVAALDPSSGAANWQYPIGALGFSAPGSVVDAAGNLFYTAYGYLISLTRHGVLRFAVNFPTVGSADSLLSLDTDGTLFACIGRSVAAIEPPVLSAPRNLSAVAGGYSIRLTWEEPEVITDPISRYLVFRKDDTSTYFSDCGTAYGESASIYFDSAITLGKTYSYVVRAADQNGLESVNSNIASASFVDIMVPIAEITDPPSGVPFNVAVVDFTGRATDPNGNFDAYRIRYRPFGATWYGTAVDWSYTPVGSETETGPLGLWDTTGLVSGYYEVRLSVLDKAANLSTAAATLFIDTSGLPLTFDWFVSQVEWWQGLEFSPKHSHRLPTDVTVDAEDFVYIVDAMNHRVQKYTALGQHLFDFGTKSTGRDNAGGTFNKPQQAAVLAGGHVLVTDQLNDRVQEFNSAGEFVAMFGDRGNASGQFKHPTGIAVDESGRVYIADTGNHRIQVLTRAGSPLLIFGSYGTGDGQFDHPTGVAVRGDETIHVTDGQNNRIQVFSSTGEFHYAFGTEGTAAGQYQRPNDDVFDTFSQLFIADMQNHRIQRVGPGGATTAVIGHEGRELGAFRRPHGVDVDTTSSFLYVADTQNNRVVKFPVRATEATDEIDPIAEINSPLEGQRVAGIVDVQGIAADAYFKTYRLEYGVGPSATSFVTIRESTTPVWNGVLGAWTTAQLDPGVYTLRLVVSDHIGRVSKASVVVEVQIPMLADMPRKGRLQ